MSQSPLCTPYAGFYGQALHPSPEIPYQGERLEQHGEVRVLMAGGEWAPGVPREIRKQYAKPRPATDAPVTVKRRLIGNWDSTRREHKRDHMIPRVIELRRNGQSWRAIGVALNICDQSARGLYTRGLALRGKADFSWK